MPEQEHYHYDDAALTNSVTHHELSDVATKPLLVFFVIFLVFSAFMYAVVYGLYQVFVHMERSNGGPSMTDMQKPDSMNIPAEPRLQPFPNRDAHGEEIVPNRNTPVSDLADMRKAEQDALDNYGWIDPQRGIVRLPIAVGKKLALQRGFPVEPSASAPPSSNMSPTGQPMTDNAPRNPATAMQLGDGNPASINMTQQSGSSTSTTATSAPVTAAPATPAPATAATGTH
jgi:hypothetical protein